ncbi:hypothetical protein [Paracoccus beibuensis]|uniref:hypothetical protein n=1 Tax=Paracoccus beibuensis TaxID=547602 RepID=UPI0022405466|nr:hypothetical protein [Paracoccus beibuensis]
MSLAMFKLESFSTALTDRGAVVTFTQEELDQAYADGVADARAQAEDAELRSLGAGLAQLAESLAADEARRQQLRQDAVDALCPILTQIVDLIAPPASSRRLEEALRAELARLAQRSQPLTARIACSDRLRALVELCVAQAGLDGIEIGAAPTDRILVTLQGGRIEIAPDAIAGDIRALLEEINEDQNQWTH